MKRFVKFLIISIVTILFVTSCITTAGYTRDCDDDGKCSSDRYYF